MDHERALAAAHAIVTAAKQGDPQARSAIAQVILQAESGDELCAHVAAVLEHASAQQMIDLQIARYVHGAGMGGAPKNTGTLGQR